MEQDLIPYSASTGLPAKAALVLAPHPDDEVFGCGGAIACHVRAGVPVHVLVLTDGALYGDAALRQSESTAAARVLGYGEPEFWNHPDRGLRYDEALVRRLVEKITQTGADVVYAPSPWEIHPDHRQTQLLAVEAVRRSALDVRLAFYEIGAPLRPNLLLDITPHMETKAAAMRCFASQLSQQDYLGQIQALNRFRTFTLAKEVLAAEAFWMVSAQDLDRSVWRDLLSGVSLGMRSFKPLLAAGSTSAIKSEYTDLQAPIQPVLRTTAPTQTASPGTVSVCVLIRTMDRPSLQDAIASVVAQSFTNWQIIVVNASGHPLTTPHAARADQMVSIVEPGRPLGRSAAANALLDAAQGKYAVFLDDDDQFFPDHLDKLVRALEANPALIAAYSDVQATLIPSDDDLDTRVHVYQREFDRSLLQFQNYLPIHSMLFRLDATRGGMVCRFDEELALFEDWDFWLQLAKKGDFRRTPGVSALYVLDSATGSGHAVLGAGLRKSMLQRLATRQLTRWNAADIVQLIDWQDQRTTDLEEARQQIRSSIEQLERTKAAVAALTQSAIAQQTEISKLGHLRLSLLAQLEQAHKSMAELDHLRLAYLQQLERAQDSIANMARQRFEHLQQIEQAKADIADLNQSVQEHERRLVASNANEFAQQLEIQKLGRLRLEHLQQLDEFNAKLLQIHQSKSWRLTRPLRVTWRIFSWLASPAPLQLLRNGLRAANGEIRRHDLSGFVRRLPHYFRNRKTYGAVLASPLPQSNAELFKAAPPDTRERRLHPDLTEDKGSIDASVSIVIPTLNAGPEFSWLLRKLLSQKGLKQLEIVIVDSGSQDETVALATAAGCRVVEITPAEFTHSHARNLGAAHASADYLIFMVQDAYPIGEHWVYGMLRYLLDHAESGLVAASCSEYSRSDSDMMYDSMIDTHYRFLGCHEQDRIGDYKGSGHMALRSRGQLSDVACLISRQVFSQYGYQGDYAEDLDLGIRLIKDGHKVAMLASVKVVHSHNRAAFYYLKRSYVDVIFLVGMFDDFLIPAMDSVPGLLLGIVSCARHVAELLPALRAKQPGTALSIVMTEWMTLCRQQSNELRMEGPCALGDERLDRYVDALAERVKSVTLDNLAHSEARRFADSFFARLDHFNKFVAEVYGATDAGLESGLQDAVRKTFAASAGSALGFMYMDELRSGGQIPALVKAINEELRAGV